MAVEEAQKAGVAAMCVVGVDLESCQRAISLAETFENVWAIVGWHPNYCSGFKVAQLDPVRDWLSHPKCVALGEIGLDYHWDHASKSDQMLALESQLHLATEMDVPIVFHCREAYDDLLTVLEARGPGKYLFHCFAGNSADADRAVALGGMFGVDGPVTYPKADDLRSVLAHIGLDRLVLETDSPYMAPVPYRGKPNKPANVPFVAGGLADALGVAVDEVARVTTANAERFFGRALVSATL